MESEEIEKTDKLLEELEVQENKDNKEKIENENKKEECDNDQEEEEDNKMFTQGFKQLEENTTVILSRKIRIFIFVLFLILSVVVDMDSGIFSSCVEYLTNELFGGADSKYGLFVSISFVGRIVGLVIFMIVINFKHRKLTLILTIVLHGSSYVLYSLTDNNYVLIFAKMFAAANKVCASVYRPVWIEQFGLSRYKSVLFSLVQIMSSYGQTIGFNLGSYLFKEKWRLGLILIMILMYIIALFFLFIPVKYFKRSYMYCEDILVDTIDDNKDHSNMSPRSSSVSNRQLSAISGQSNGSTINRTESKLSNSSKSNKSDKKKRKTFFVNLKKLKTNKKKKNKNQNFKHLLKTLLFLLKNRIYLLCVIKRANITFIYQIIHSYVKSYQLKALSDVVEDLIAIFYSISTLVSPAVGGLIGGVTSKFLGGYTSKKTILVVIIPEILTTIAISFLAFTSKFYVYNISLILFFCFVSIGSPVIQGYLIITIPKDIKAVGVGLDMIVSTFLGKIPGPIIYGLLEDKYSKTMPSLAWRVCLSYFYVGVIVVFILCYFKYHEKINENASEVKLEDHVIDIAAISSGTDANDQFRLDMPIPKRRSKTTYKKEMHELPN